MLRYGLISEIDAAKGMARVHFNDDDIVSDWLPILVPKAMEDSFSFFPDINEHVACLMDEHSENGVVMGSLYNSQTQPNGGNADKFRMRFKDGTVIEYDRAGNKLFADVKGEVEVKAQGAVKVDGESTVDVTAAGAVKVETSSTAEIKATAVTIDSPTVTCTGALTAASISTSGGGAIVATGSITAHDDIKSTDGDVKAMAISLLTHKHGGVQSGGSQTSTPSSLTTINDIQSVNWQVGIGGLGEVVENLADIRQCIGIIITTSKGSDPLRPEFGTDIYRLIDRPVNTAAPAIVREILTGIQLWEPRVKVKSLVYTLAYESILFELNLELLVNGDAAQILFEIDKASKTGTDDFTGRAFGRGFSFAFK